MLLPPRLPKPPSCHWGECWPCIILSRATKPAPSRQPALHGILASHFDVPQTLKQEILRSCCYHISPFSFLSSPFPSPHLAWAALWLLTSRISPVTAVLQQYVSRSVVHREANFAPAAMSGALLRYPRSHTLDGDRRPPGALQRLLRA
jgi:hypothetical protein